MLSVTPGKKCCIIKSMSNKKEVVVNFNDIIRFCSLIYRSIKNVVSLRNISKVFSHFYTHKWFMFYHT